MAAEKAVILHTGRRLRLRVATLADLDYIMRLEDDPANVPFIVPFDREFHQNIIENGQKLGSLDIIVETIADGEAVGYLLVNGLHTEQKEAEWMHILIDKKGQGYGHEALQLLKAWNFEDLKFHRAWLDCKEYNARALHVYESEGLKREGLIRETIITNGIYENLVVLGILDREYAARKNAGLEIDK